MAKADGGPAFPNRWADGHEDMGMSLRDWFAGKAPDAKIEFPDMGTAAAFAGMPEPEVGDMEAAMKVAAACRARVSYSYADAMLAARSKEAG